MNSNFKLLILIYQLGLLITCNQFQIDPTKFQTLQTEYFILCLNFLQNQSSRFDYWSNFIQISNLAHNTLIDFNFLSYELNNHHKILNTLGVTSGAASTGVSGAASSGSNSSRAALVFPQLCLT